MVAVLALFLAFRPTDTLADFASPDVGIQDGDDDLVSELAGAVIVENDDDDPPPALD
jgi:hypothetical protein